MTLIFSDRWFIGCALIIIGSFGLAGWLLLHIDKDAESWWS